MVHLVVGVDGRFLPHQRDLLRDPMDQLHPLVCLNRPRLAAWKLSGNNTQQEEFCKTPQGHKHEDAAFWQTDESIMVLPVKDN